MKEMSERSQRSIYATWVVHRAIKLADMIDELGKWLSATKMMGIEDSVGYVHSYFACNG